MRIEHPILAEMHGINLAKWGVPEPATATDVRPSTDPDIDYEVMLAPERDGKVNRPTGGPSAYSRTAQLGLYPNKHSSDIRRVER